ncbi:hypothetical protein FB107DRAFT_272883 [Schizophyllum commune]
MDATATTPMSAFSTSGVASSHSQLPIAITRPPRGIANNTWPTNEASRSHAATNSAEGAAYAIDVIQTSPSDVAMDPSQSQGPSPCMRPVAYRNEAYLDDEGNLCCRCFRVTTLLPDQSGAALSPKPLRRHETFIVAEPEP